MKRQGTRTRHQIYSEEHGEALVAQARLLDGWHRYRVLLAMRANRVQCALIETYRNKIRNSVLQE